MVNTILLIVVHQAVEDLISLVVLGHQRHNKSLFLLLLVVVIEVKLGDHIMTVLIQFLVLE